MIAKHTFLKSLPIPPSVNNIYSRGRGGHVRKSDEYVLFERLCTHWSYKHSTELGDARQLCADLDQGEVIKVYVTFWFRKQDVIAKPSNGNKKRGILPQPERPKRNDTDNRIKALFDSVSKMIQVNDCYFWDISIEKRILATDHPGFVDMKLEIMKLPV